MLDVSLTGLVAIGFNESTLVWIWLWIQVVLNVYPVPTNGCMACWRDGTVGDKKPGGRAGPRVQRVDLRGEAKRKPELHRGPDDVSL